MLLRVVCKLLLEVVNKLMQLCKQQYCCLCASLWLFGQITIPGFGLCQLKRLQAPIEPE